MFANSFRLSTFGGSSAGPEDEQKIPDDYNHQSDQLEFINSEISKKILTAYEDELVIIKAGAKCREAIAKINELYDELMCNDGYDMITLERCAENKRNELRDDIASFWFDFSRTKTDTGLDKLCKEAEKYFSSLKAEVDSTRKQQANQVLPKAFLKVTKDAQMVKSAARDFIKAVFFTSYPNENEKKQQVRTKPYNEILVPTYQAQLLLAEYYQRKYGIQIVILRDWKQNLASYIKKLIQSPSIKVGFIIWTGTLSEEHVVPLIFENVSGKNYLVDLDCLSYGKKDPWDSNEKYFNVKKLAMYLVENQLGDKIELFSNGTALDITDATRQVDCHSCFTDAITVLREALMDKDGIQVKLRIDPEQTHNLLVNRLHNYNFFKLPGAWSISVQNKRCISYNDIEPSTTLLRARLNKSTQRLEQQTLENFFSRYTHEVTIEDYERNINCYLQQKSQKWIDVIVKLYESLTEAELIKVYYNRQGNIIDHLVLDAAKVAKKYSESVHLTVSA